MNVNTALRTAPRRNRPVRLCVNACRVTLLFFFCSVCLSQSERGLSDMNTASPAHEFYAKGRDFFKRAAAAQDSKSRTEYLKKAIGCFENAVSKDSTYVLAYLGLAQSYSSLSGIGDSRNTEALLRIKTAAVKAISLDSSYAELHQLLGWVKYQYDWDWEGSEKEFKKALELDPKFSESWPRYASLLASLGRYNEAWAEVKRVIGPGKDPAWTNFTYGYILYWGRQYDGAMKYYRAAIGANPKQWLYHFYMGLAEAQDSLCEEAVEEFRRGVILSGSNTAAVAGLGYGYALVGKRHEAVSVLGMLEKGWQQLRSVFPSAAPPYRVAAIYAALGEKDLAFSWLEKGMDTRSAWMVWLMVDPVFNNLHKDPRFGILLKRIGLKKN